MDRILNSELPLYCYGINPLFITEVEGANKVLTEFKDLVNKGIKHFQENKSDLENCSNLKHFLDHKLAELRTMNFSGGYYSQMAEKIEDMIETLETGIALGEKEQMYHSEGSQVYKWLPWYDEEHNWDTQTMEGYLKSHYREFSVPTYSFRDFMRSGYFKHCLIHNWDARETAETFCRLYNK